MQGHKYRYIRPIFYKNNRIFQARYPDYEPHHKSKPHTLTQTAGVQQNFLIIPIHLKIGL